MVTKDLSEAADTGVRSLFFLQSLKQATSQSHLALESQELLASLMQPTVSKYHYYCYLVLMQKIQVAFEKQVLPKLTFLFSSDQHRNASAIIEEDLQYLASTWPHTATISECLLATEGMTTGFALGIMYVIEGSKLGGRVIYKHISGLFSFSADAGAKYIANYGGDTGKDWRNFLATFSTYVTENNTEEEALHGAKYAFDFIYNYFESNRAIYAV